VPTIAFYKDYGVVRSIGDQIGVCGYDVMVSYLFFFYVPASGGVIFLFAALWAKRWKKDTMMGRVRINSWQKFGLLIEIPIILFNFFLMGVSPRNCDTLYVQLTLLLVGVVVMLLTLAWIAMPTDNQINTLATQMAVVAGRTGTCNVVDCQAVRTFAVQQLDGEPIIKTYQGEDGFTTTLWLRGVHTVFTGSLPAKTIKGHGGTSMESIDDAYTKAAVYWGGIPAFVALRASLMKDSNNWVSASPSLHPSETPRKARSRSETRRPRDDQLPRYDSYASADV
jgi:hypothetical protein